MEMTRQRFYLLSAISLFILLCQNNFVGSLYGQTIVINKPDSNSLITEKKNAAESQNNEQTLIHEKKEKQSSPELTNTFPRKRIQNEKKREQGRDIMEEALELLNGSRDYWIKGDLENALDLLDQAYALLLDTNGEPDIVRQKDDIRLLISKQLLAIYSSKHTTTNGKRSEIPHIVNSDVEKEIRLFQTVEKDFFIQSYGRSSLYRPIILQELKKAGLPEELSWLPLVESGFKIHALSRARALGLWQFIPSTGYKYGLNRDEWIDERLDLEKSTRAAIDYLKELHSMFGDWLTVLAAYNCGEGRVLKVISRQHINYFDRFWDFYHQLPNETARYVPRFLATIQIIKEPHKYGIDLNEGYYKQNPYQYEVVKISKSMKLEDIANHLGTSEDALNSLNSELRQKITPEKEYNLKVPIGTAEKFAKILDEIPKYEKPRQIFVHYRARRGESVVSVARKYRTSVSAIMAYNHISGRKKLKAGQRLIIPVHGADIAKAKSIKYKVKKGDTIGAIAKKYEISVEEIKSLNGFKKRKSLKSDQIIILSAKNSDKQQSEGKEKDTGTKKRKDTVKNVVSKTYTVQKGDNLDKIAKKNGISLDKICEINKLAKDDNIRPGQVIVVK